ncbi:leucine-rich repeat domain-containing protein [Barnesiella intestinihominis]|uniref:leucine-rich repeat domain-containing protein n=1 Tax=Barnesiella intestinihominis TaxID=487174 RepID=UPI003AF04B04
MKKYVRYLLVLLMCSSLTGVKAQTTFPFDGIRYCLDGSEAQVFDGRYYSESKLIIPNSVWYNGIKYPVTSIRYHAFYECKSLTEVTIPNSVTTIGNGAFDSCTGLQKVIWNARNIQDPQIFNQPFSGCDRLTDFVFGEEVEYIPNYLCFQLTSLKKLVIGNSVTTIGMWAFYECTGLTEVTISNSVTTIGYKAFDGCTGLQKVIWNARNAQDLQYVYDNPIFPDCNQLTDFVFGEEVEHIPDFLCNNLRLLNTIVIPNSVTTIGQLAFNSCTGLQKVTIGNSVTTIGERAFSECRGLQKVTIGNSVTTIGNFAFTSCTGLQKVTIGNSVTAIGYGAFYSCTGLTEVIWNARNAQDFQDNSSPFSGCDRLTDFVFGEKVEHIPAYLCYQLASLKKLVIGNSVTSIGKMAFSSCTGLTEVTIPNSVTTIGDGAFNSCTGLTEVTIPNSVTTIGDGAFSGCTGLTEVTIPNSVTAIGYVAFSGCTGLQKVIWNTRNAQCLQDKFIWSPFKNCDRLTDFIFGEEVEHIPDYLCYNLTLLNTIVIPNSVTTIGERAFSECRGLQKVTIGNSVTTIGKFAFTSCTGLQKVTIGNSVTAIGYGAFDSCSGLTEITIPNAVTTIGVWAFSSCTGLTEVTIPNSVTTIEGYAFTRCTGLKTVTIGNSVTTIEDGAFNGCTQMESVTIGEKVESIGESAFAKCNNLTAVISKAMTPPQIWATTFDDYAMTLYVPAGCKPKYAEAEYWNNFTDIRETGVTLHTVTANATDETMGYVTGGGEYPQGSTATLIAVPFGQNYFVRWNDGNTDNPRTITVTGNMTFTAEFAPAGSAVETLENGERGIYATGRTLHVENGGESYRVYTAAGRLVYTGNDSSVTLSAPGMYIVRTGDRSQKVAVK